MRKHSLGISFAAAVLIAACSGSGDSSTGSDASADEYPEDAYPVTVSGVSSGGYMAVQTHIALADRVSGAGIVAGGPYHCAEDSVRNALGPCRSGEDLDVASLASFTREAAASGSVAPTDFLREANVWVFHSPEDQVVVPAVSAALVDFYREFVDADRIRFVDDVETAHGWPTLDVGNQCLEQGGDFINACDYDAAGNLLNHLYTDLEPRVPGARGGELSDIDLSAYLESGSGIADTGFSFVPDECRQSDADCRLHISFHGCLQGAEYVDDRFAANAGLNEWAADNRIVVIYPQIESSLMNPKGCWDWWGYTGSNYDLKSGEQVTGIGAIIGAFASRRLLSLTDE